MIDLRDVKRGVITSSSIRDLSDFVSEVHFLVGEDVVFDLFLLRDTDIDQIELHGGKKLFPERRNDIDDRLLADIIAHDGNLEIIYQWGVEQFAKSKNARIAAFATYFPDISSPYPEKRAVAVRAIVNSVRLGCRFRDEGPQIANSSIIELVGGSILEPCACTTCKSEGRIFEFDRDEKMNWIVESLKQVVTQLDSNGLDAIAKHVGLAFEVEPGDTYVLNDIKAVDKFFEKVDAEPMLEKIVGLNLDVAHMRIISIAASELERHKHRIMHAHISDHPGMHTRDQRVGDWTCTYRREGGYSDYLRLLLSRVDVGELPYSKTVALELEGCNRIAWVSESLVAMRQCIAMASQQK